MKNLVSRLTRLSQSPDLSPLAIIVAAAVLSHRNWFFSLQAIAVGDWPYLWPPWMQMFLGPPISWMSEFDLGYYNSSAASHWIQAMMGLLSAAHVDYAIIERILYFWPAALLPGLSFYFFMRPSVGHMPALVAGLVYELNTAALFYGAAHLNFAMAYGLAPLLFLFERGAIARSSARTAAAFGLVLAGILAYEPRFGYILTWAALGYLGFLLLRHPSMITKSNASAVALMFMIPVAVHGYWLLPALLFPSQAFSVLQTRLLVPFITLPYSITLYDPFWSGGHLANFEVQRLPWYAFLLPLFVFASLLTRRPRADTIFFGFMAVAGVFLAKQDTPPLPDVYRWLFAHFPGFVLFRESSKFYILVGVGYAFLMGALARDVVNIVPRLRLERLRVFAAVRRRKVVALLAVGIITGSSLMPSQAAFAGTLGYGYDTTSVPAIYTDLAGLIADNGFSRVLWFLAYPTFGFRSNAHPAVNAVTFFPNYQDRLPKDATLRGYLDLLSVKYVVQTNDSTYPGDQSFDYLRIWYSHITTNLSLERIAGYPGAEVWKNPTALPHVYALELDPLRITDPAAVLSARRILLDIQDIGVDELRVAAPQGGPFVLVLSEGYDPNWIADDGGQTIVGTPLLGLLNAFVVDNRTGNTIVISYRAQAFYVGGAVVSIVAIAIPLAYSIHPFNPWPWLTRRRRGRRTESRPNHAIGDIMIRKTDGKTTIMKFLRKGGDPDRSDHGHTKSLPKIPFGLRIFWTAHTNQYVQTFRKLAIFGGLCLLAICTISTGVGGSAFTDALIQAAYVFVVLGVALAVLQFAPWRRRTTRISSPSDISLPGPSDESGLRQP